MSSAYVPHMYRIASAYVLHMFRMVSAGHVAMAQPRERPRSSQCALLSHMPALCTMKWRGGPAGLPCSQLPMSSAYAPHAFRICSAYVPHMFHMVSTGHPCGYGPALGEAQVVPVPVIFASSGPAHTQVEGRTCLPAMLAAPHEFRTCSAYVLQRSAYVRHMFRICSAYVPHGIRRPCGHGPAQGEAQDVPVRVIFAYSGPVHAEVGGRAYPPAMLAAPPEFCICSAYVPHMFRICSAHVLHGIRRACGHDPAQGEAQVVPVRVIFAYPGPAHAEVGGGLARLPR